MKTQNLNEKQGVKVAVKLTGLMTLAIAALMVGGSSVQASANEMCGPLHGHSVNRASIRRDNRDIHRDRQRVARLNTRMGREVNHNRFRMAKRTDQRINAMHRDIRHDRMDRNRDRRES